MTRVAFLGVGRMGAPIATNLAAAGHDLVLYNRTRSRATALAEQLGAEVAATPREAATGSDVAITMLADEAALRAVLDGEDGLLHGLPSGGIVIDMGTTGPAATSHLASWVAEAGGLLVDAPVSGSTAAAQAAELTIMVGAPEQAFPIVQPLLAAVGSSVFHLGDTGAGATMKLAVNNVIYGLSTAVAEALVLAERAGLDREQVYAVFEDSAVAAPMVRYRRDAYVSPETTPAAFALALAQKDLELITALAASFGLPVAQARANLGLIQRANDAGYGDRDLADVAAYLRNATGTR